MNIGLRRSDGYREPISYYVDFTGGTVTRHFYNESGVCSRYERSRIGVTMYCLEIIKKLNQEHVDRIALEKEQAKKRSGITHSPKRAFSSPKQKPENSGKKN